MIRVLFQFFVFVFLLSPYVLAQKIVVGCSCPLSGPKEYLGKYITSGLLSYFNYVNDKNILGRKVKIELKALDDRFNPNLTLKNTKDFLTNINPVALTSYIGTSSVVKVLNLINKEKMPLIGPLTGTHQLRLPFRPYVFNVRNSFFAEAEALVDYVFKTLKKSKVSIVYQNDEYGLTGYKGVCRVLAMRYNKTLVSEATYEKGKMVTKTAIRKIFQARPEVVIIIGQPEAISRFIKSSNLHKRTPRPLFMTLSSVGSMKLLKLLRKYGNGVLVSQVVPPPNSNIKIAKEYRSLMGKYFPNNPLSFIGLEAFLNAKVLVEGLKRSKNITSTSSLIKGLETFKKYDPGIDTTIDYGPFDREGLDLVFITEIRKGKFILRKTLHKKVSLYFF